VRDFAPITLAVTTPNVLVAKPQLNATSMKDLVDFAKANPGRLSYCSSGTGSSDHLTAELLKQMSSTFAVHVPYRGGAACQTDLMGNQVDYSFQNLGAVTNYIRAGRMKAFAVTAKARHPQLPNVPSVAEAGFPELVVTSWQAAAAPAKTPTDIVERLNQAAVKALRSSDVAERMAQIGFDVVASTPQEFGKFMQEEVGRWTKVVQRGGITPD
jgi:tripartite-type tricarboxylate transporter receptor subunit TctC